MTYKNRKDTILLNINMKVTDLLQEDFYIPDPVSLMNDATIKDIIDNERWTHHGDDGNNWVRFLQEDDRFQDLEDQVENMLWNGTNKIKQQFYSSPEFLSRFKDYLMMRATYIREEQFSTMYADTSIERVMMVNESVIIDIENDSPPVWLGVYWSDQTGEAYWADTNDQNLDHLRVYTKLGNARVNWYDTVRARLDWVIGLEENEIQLVPNSLIRPPVKFEWLNQENGDPIDTAFKAGTFKA